MSEKKKRKKEKKAAVIFLSERLRKHLYLLLVCHYVTMQNSEWFHGKWQTDSTSHKNANAFFFFFFFFTCFHTLLVHIVRTTTGQKWELRRIYRHKCPDCIAVLAVGTLPLALIIKSDPRWAPSAEVASQNEVQSEGSGGGVYFSGPNNERLWSKPVPDQRFSEPSVTLFRL